MTYCRWHPDIDVYLFMAIDDQLDFCHCSVGLPGKRADFVVRDHRDMLSHLGMHLEVGHRIPVEAIGTLKSQTEGAGSRESATSETFLTSGTSPLWDWPAKQSSLS